jgi:hypothetical protein
MTILFPVVFRFHASDMRHKSTFSTSIVSLPSRTYVFGSALHAFESLARAAAAKSNPGLLADALAFGRKQLATGQFPRLAALDPKQPAPDKSKPNSGGSSPIATALSAQFDLGLEALLDGLIGRMNLTLRSLN